MKTVYFGDVPEGGMFPLAIFSAGRLRQCKSNISLGWYVCIQFPMFVRIKKYNPCTDCEEVGKGWINFRLVCDMLKKIGGPLINFRGRCATFIPLADSIEHGIGRSNG